MSYARKLLLTSNSTSNATPPQFSPPPPKSPESTEAAVALESDFAVLLAALLCAIISVLGLVVVARCAWLRRGSDGRRFSFGGGNRLANKGLKKKVLEALPKYTHNSDTAATAAVVEDCAICLAEYVDGDEIRVLPQCGHRFHLQCIDMWLGSHSSCPSCRQILVVNRCHKCGEFPSSGGGGGSGGGSGGGGGGGGYIVDKLSPVSAASTSTPTFFL